MPLLSGFSAPNRTVLRRLRPAGSAVTRRLAMVLVMMTAWGSLACSARREVPTEPLVHEAYLWQDPQRPAAAAALKRARENKLSAIAILAAEASVRDGHLTFREIPEPPTGRDIIHVVRLGQSTTGTVWTGANRESVARLVERLAQLHPCEIQIDFDCPARRLGDYHTLLDDLRARAAGVPVAFTALPSWLDVPSFPALARAHPRYVLQVHSLDLPTRPGDAVVLCDPAAARRAVARASELGVPFRVALPTYGSEVLFDGEGKILDVVSEDSSLVPSTAIARRQRVFADPVAMGSLAREWTTRRPAGLTGICWYRLPVEGDRRNWTWSTFTAALAGNPHADTVEIHVRPAGPSLYHITLVNPGNGHAALPDSFALPAETLAADATRPYHPEGEKTPIFLLDPADPTWPWLAPGQELVVGWFRHPAPPARLTPAPRP